MSDESIEHSPLDGLVEEFVARYRRGERPALTEYANRHPELADEIREVFPALVMMEQVRPDQPEADANLASGLIRSADGKKLERLGDYRILREVGRGGMGIVYEAEQESLGRHVALKVLPTHALLDPRHLQRFEREARAAARLHHTNIVPVFGVGVQDGLHYYVMQFIQGQGLDQVLVELKRLRKAKQSGNTGDSARNERDPAPSGNGAGDAERSTSAATLSAVQAAEALLSGQFHAADGALKPVDNTDGRSDASFRVRMAADSSSSVHLLGQQPHTTLSETGRQYWQSVARIGVQVADALAYANSQGVQHRDIKPANLLLDTQGTVWVTDFGLAKATPASPAFDGGDLGADLTHTGDIVGTLRYLAPERLHGQSDQRSDIYSLGVTLYELLTLRPAFDESDRNKLVRQVSQEDPPRPRTISPEMPRDIETVVLKALAKDPADRYLTAADLASDLRRFLEDKPIRARRASPLERSWRWCRRNPLVASLSASLAVLVAVLGVGMAIAHLLRTQRDRAVVSEVRAKQAEGEVRDLLDRAVAAEREVQIRSYLAQATAYRRSGQPGQRYKCLSELTKAVELNPSEALRAELRDEAIACMALVDLRAVDVSAVAGEPTLAFDRSYRQYAFMDNEAKIHIRRVGEPCDLRELSGLGHINANLSFSANGRYLVAMWNGGPAQIWEVESGRPVFREPVQMFIHPSFSPDERRVAVCLLAGSVEVYELPSGRELDRLPMDTVPTAIAFHPDGRRLAVGLSRPATVRIWDLDQKAVVAKLTDIKAPIHAVAWDAEGSRLAISLATPANRAEIWDVAADTRLATMDGHTQDVIISQFHPFGNLLVTGSWDGITRVWDAYSARQIVAWPSLMAGWLGRDGRMLGHIWRHNRTQLVELITEREYQTLISSLGAGQGEYRDGGISPDGRLLAVGMDDGVRIWDLQTSREVAYLPTDQTLSPIFSPDGKELITSSFSGLLRWPLENVESRSVGQVLEDPPSESTLSPRSGGVSKIRPTLQSKSHEIHIGPPRNIPLPIVPYHTRSTSNGRTLALCSAQAGEGLMVNLATETVETTIKTNSQTDRVVLSPDGRWAATTGWHVATVQVWDARTGALVNELPLGAMTMVAFSPDSKHLITSRSDEFCFWEVGSWRKVNTIPRENCPYPGAIAFSPDGSVMALELASAVVSLLDVETGRTLAKLEDPHRDRPGWMGFTPDGSRFVVVSTYARNIHVWDLRLIREQLATMGLDWAPSSVLPREYVAADDPPLVTVDLGDFGPRAEARRATRQAKTHYDLAQAHLASKRWPEAVAASKRAVELSPENATFRNNLAWLLATCPDPLYRDEPLAAEHAAKAVEFEPVNPESWNTLGVARYRVGQWQSAIDALTKAEQFKPGTYFGHNAFFLAMAHWRIGEKDAARNWFEQAVQWLTTANPTPHEREELDRFRAEAEDLIGRL